MSILKIQYLSDGRYLLLLAKRFLLAFQTCNFYSDRGFTLWLRCLRMCVYSLSSCFEMEGERRKKKKCLVRLKVFFKHRKNSKNAHLPRIVRGRYIIIGIIIVRFQSGCRLLSVAQTHDSEWVNDIKPRRLFVKRDIASFFTRRCLPWLP